VVWRSVNALSECGLELPASKALPSWQTQLLTYSSVNTVNTGAQASQQSQP